MSESNEIISEEKDSAFQLLIAQFFSPLVFILMGASVLSALLGDWAEAIAIGAILLLNAMVGFFQEFKAKNAINALKNLTAPRTTVIRNSQRLVIASIDLVVGDVMIFEAGDIIGADARLSECSDFQINEAILTGESIPVEKRVASDRTGQVYMGTSVTRGSAHAIVTAIGMKTELGKIAHLMQTAEVPPTPLQIQLSRLGKVLLLICLGVVVAVVILGWLHHRPWMDLIIFSISLAVAVVPEGMPAIVTVALALGVRRMATEKALIRRAFRVSKP